jgi:ParE toxin of type II toxin-antitoxin system, parDE
MRVVFRIEAQKELLEARAWYEERSPGLGFEFARAVDVAIEQAIRMPLTFPIIEAEFRHVMTRKFPYSIIYRATASELVVVSCFHHRRKPGCWLNNNRD